MTFIINSLVLKDYITIGISLVSLSISIIVLVTNLLQRRFNIDIYQDYNGSQSAFIKSYDGREAPLERTLGKPKMNHVALARITISNKSSLPVSIISFSIGGSIAADFATHSHTEPYYLITTKKGSTVTFGYPDKPLDYLHPLFTIKPFEAVQGYVSFWVHAADEIKTNTPIELVIKTSRGIKNAKICFQGILESHEDALYAQPELIYHSQEPDIS